MNVGAGLARLARAFHRRRAAILALGALAAALGVWALAAVLARAGWWAAARWVPLMLWVLLAVLAAWVVAAVRRSPPAVRDMARLAERELALRRGALVGVVDLDQAPGAGTSAALAESARRRLAGSLPADEADWAPAAARAASARVRSRASAAGGALLLAVLALWYAGDAAAALRSPARAIRHALRPRLSIAVSAALVRPGEAVTIMVQAEPGTAHVSLYARATGEGWRPVLMTMDEGGRGEHRLGAVHAPTYVYAAVAGAVSDTLEIGVIRPLVLGDLAMLARYPAYLERPDEPLDGAAGPLVLPVGTVVEVSGRASAALVGARLVAPGDTADLRPAGAAFAGRFTVRRSATWTLALTAVRGGALADPPAIEVRAVPDSAPVVTVPVPGADTSAPLDLKPAIVVDARDDHGLGRVEVLSWRVSRLGVVGDTVRDTLAGLGGADRIVQTEVLDLTGRGLLPGDTLRYFVRAFDRAPRPNEGRSREFAFRLRSLSELREAVRTGGDSLAGRAQSLAADQTALNRETQDLAAQRNRAGDRAQPRTADPREARAREQAGQGNMEFEQAAQAQRLADRQQDVLARAESLRADLQRLSQAAQDAGLNDPEFQRQLQDLDRLLRQALTPELMQRLEELRRALQNLDPRQVQDALRRLAEQQQALRQELQRSAELFERAAIEGTMQTTAQETDALRREQEEWARRAEQRRDSSAAAREEERMRRLADSLASRLDQLQQRLGERGDTSAQRTAAQAAQSLQQAGRQMQRAQQAMQSGRRSEAGEAGEQAAQSLENVPDMLQEAQAELANNWRQEVLQRLGLASHETVQMAREEADLARQIRQGAAGPNEVRGRQSAIEQGIGQTMRTLQAAAGRNALVSPRLGAMLAQAREQVAQSRQALEGPSPSPDEAAERASDAARTLAAAATQMMRNAEDVGGAQSGSGFAEAVERMGRMAGQQGQINDQLGGLLPMLGAGDQAIQQQLRLLAERQRQLANQLERMGEANIPGRPEQMADEARQLADRIEQGRLDRATLERQQRLFRRMLDAGRSLRNDEEPEDPERQSRAAEGQRARPAPGPAPARGGLRYPPPAWSDLRGLAPEERALVLDYFRRLNAAGAGPDARP